MPTDRMTPAGLRPGLRPEDRERALDEHAAALALAREIAGPDGIVGVILDDDRMIITVPPRDQH
jgi:hypothetical protein